MNKFFVVIQGATASGKTSLAIDIAKMLNTEILSADSRQFYKELNIGVAKPTKVELGEVKHHFISSHSIKNELNAATYSQEAREFTNTYFETNNCLVVVGGSGMYVDAFLNGLDDLPKNPAIMNSILFEYEKNGLKFILDEIKNLDENALIGVDVQNPRRLIRLLEILRASGKKLVELKRGQLNPLEFPIIRFSINWNRIELYNRINERVDEMIRNGLKNEVDSLNKDNYQIPFQTVGYQEWQLLENTDFTHEMVIAKIKQHTRNYAKRQLTWLNRYNDLIKLDPYNQKSLLEQVRLILIENGMILENQKTK